MTRLTRIGVGVALLAVCAFCGVMLLIVWIGVAAYPGSTMGTAPVFLGIPFLACGLGAVWSFTRAFESPRKNRSSPASTADRTQDAPRPTTPDEKLAYLLKKP